MIKIKYLVCLIFLCFNVFFVFSETKIIVNKTLSIKQLEPQQQNIETEKKQFLYSIDKKSIAKHEFIDTHDSETSYIIEKKDNSFSMIYKNNNAFETLYTITFLSNNTVLINKTDTYLLREDSYLKLYNDLSSDKSIISMFKFLIFCPYFFLDENLQNLPLYFYDYEYEILKGCFYIQSPDSDFILEHDLQYQYKNGCFYINSICTDENFIGLTYQVVFNFKQNKIFNATIDVVFFERRSDKYDLIFDYRNNIITASGEITHSYFTDLINCSYITIYN